MPAYMASSNNSDRSPCMGSRNQLTYINIRGFWDAGFYHSNTNNIHTKDVLVEYSIEIDRSLNSIDLVFNVDGLI